MRAAGALLALLAATAFAQSSLPPGSSSSGTTYTGTAPIAVSGSAISCTAATTSTAGCVSASAQNIDGAKTFLSAGAFSAGLTTTTLTATGLVSSTIASGSIAFQSLTGAKWSTLTAGSHYFSDNGSSFGFTGYNGITIPTSTDVYFDGGGSVALRGGTGSNGSLTLLAGSWKQSVTALPTCASGTEGFITRDTLKGGTTGHRTAMCLCTSDGAGSPAYAWTNMTTGTVGTTTTCSD